MFSEKVQKRREKLWRKKKLEGGEDEILSKTQRNDILKCRMNKISRKWPITPNTGGWGGREKDQKASTDLDRKVSKTLPKASS